MILTAAHDIQSSHFVGYTKKIEIGNHAFIGSRALIILGVTIGIGAVVAAGSVVTESIPEFEVWAGVPAKKIGDRNKSLYYRHQYNRLFH